MLLEDIVCHGQGQHNAVANSSISETLLVFSVASSTIGVCALRHRIGTMAATGTHVPDTWERTAIPTGISAACIFGNIAGLFLYLAGCTGMNVAVTLYKVKPSG